MRRLTIALAGTLIAAAGLIATPSVAQPGSLSMGGRAPHFSRVPAGALGFKGVRGHKRSSQLSPHIGLPGISGFPNSPRISPHIGLPGISGFPAADSRHRRGHGDHGGNGDDFLVWGWGYYEGDGDGYVDTIPMADEFGFFSTGGEVTMERGKPIYHYDRSYPYDWYGGAPKKGGPRAESGLKCEMRNVSDETQGEPVSVRVCSPTDQTSAG